MNARQKLNIAHVIGALIVAGVIGGIAGSWAVFGVAFAILIALSLSERNIRPK